MQGLKVFEAAFNSLTALPPSFAKLASLETLLLAHNALSSLAPLAPLGNLASVTLDNNKLTSLEDMGLDRKPRLALLSVRSNAVAALPAAVGECALLQQLLARGNALRDVPYELCTLKKLRDLELEDNPIDDPKIKKMMQKPASFVKEVCQTVLAHPAAAPLLMTAPTDHAVSEEARQGGCTCARGGQARGSSDARCDSKRQLQRGRGAGGRALHEQEGARQDGAQGAGGSHRRCYDAPACMC